MYLGLLIKEGNQVHVVTGPEADKADMPPQGRLSHLERACVAAA